MFLLAVKHSIYSSQWIPLHLFCSTWILAWVFFSLFCFVRCFWLTRCYEMIISWFFITTTKHNYVIFYTNIYMVIHSLKIKHIVIRLIEQLESIFITIFYLFIFYFIYLFFFFEIGKSQGFFKKSFLIACPTHTNPPGSGLGTRGTSRASWCQAPSLAFLKGPLFLINDFIYIK